MASPFTSDHLHPKPSSAEEEEEDKEQSDPSTDGEVKETKTKKPDSVLDREEAIVADLLTRFKNMIVLAGEPTPDGATKEVAASQALRMDLESAALVRAAENLLGLTRELKEMWLFGPLRGIGEGVGVGIMDEDSKVVGEMVERLLEKGREGEAL